MMDNVIAFPRQAATFSPDAVVRVASGNGRVHHASLKLVEKHQARPADDHSPARLVCCCTYRLDDAAIVLAPVSCSACAPGAHNRRDVTEEVVAGCLA